LTATFDARTSSVTSCNAHPLGQVLNVWNLLTLGVVLAGVIGLSILKRMVLPMLMDLL